MLNKWPAIDGKELVHGSRNEVVNDVWRQMDNRWTRWSCGFGLWFGLYSIRHREWYLHWVWLLHFEGDWNFDFDSLLHFDRDGDPDRHLDRIGHGHSLDADARRNQDRWFWSVRVIRV